jgi:biotin-dependent carboxylase-like uncharacterized protein
MIVVTRAGSCDLIVDLGRPGWAASGVPAGGAADPQALVAANRLVGNRDDAAGLELTLHGPALHFLRAARVAVTGAGFAATRGGNAPLPWNETLTVGAGETLDFGRAASGVRCWLAVDGGIDVPRVLGSRSTCLPGAFGGFAGRALRRGDRLPLGAAAADGGRRRARPPAEEPEGILRVVPGPQIRLFSDRGLSAFFCGTYCVTTASDRRGLRLAGAPCGYPPVDLPSQGVLPGAIQVPADGQPIILGWDGPVTGGYPVIATVIGADLPRLAQLAPGARVRFGALTRGAAAAQRAGEWVLEALDD